MISLRPYQQQAINDIKIQFTKGNNAVILQAPTGAGKTIMFTSIAKSAIEKGKTVLVITDRKELLTQAGGAFESFGLSPEYLTAQTKKIKQGKLFIAMSETIKRRLDQLEYIHFFKSFNLIIIDEAHKASFDTLFTYLDKTQYVIGATATPYRKGNKTIPLSKFYQTIVNTIGIDELIKECYLAKPLSYGIPLDFNNVKLKQGEFDAKEVQQLYEDKGIFEGVIENYNRLTPNSKTLLFSASVETSLKICDKLNNAGISAKHIDAKSKYRTEILKQFENNEFKVLCNVGILTTGYDCPSVETIILYRATMSLPLFLQMVGRGSRITKTKYYFNILDFGGNIQRHNFWEGSRVWSLELAKKPKKTIGVESVKNCPSCGAFIPLSFKTCNYCGYKYPPTQEEKEKEIVIKLELLEQKDLKIKDIMLIQKVKGYSKYWILHQLKTREQFKEYAEIMNYKDNWVEINFKRIYGR